MTSAEITAFLASIDFASMRTSLLTLFTGMAGISALTFVARRVISNIR